jgi:hypothetical protein
MPAENIPNLNEWINAFIGKTWIAIGVFLIMLRETARQTGNLHVRKAYVVIASMFKFLRPSTELQEQKEQPEKPPKPKKPKDDQDIKTMNGG